jgi:hypothetical protein
MPVADALADAETLCLIARDNDYMIEHGLGLREILREAVLGRLNTATTLGWCARTLVAENSAEPGLTMCGEPSAYARYAARAAFRACPGLREEPRRK